jgi:glycosyltransferase involved in cell wall biosynthesis
MVVNTKMLSYKPFFLPLSIIIPFYNSASTIKKTIESAVSLGNVEIICVDDGSTDNASSFLNSINKGFSQYKLIKLDMNHGVSHARNIGLTNVTRTWVTFLDADDQIQPHVSNWLVNLIKPEFALTDIIFLSHSIESSSKSTETYNLTQGFISREEQVELVGLYLNNPKGNSIISHAWGKIYRSDFIFDHNIRFDEGLIIYEDTDFVAQCLQNSTLCYYINLNFYLYTKSRHSSLNFEFAPLSFLSFLNRLSLICKKEDLYTTAYSSLLIKSLSLGRSLSFMRRVIFIKSISIFLHNNTFNKIKIEDTAIFFIIKFRLYRFPIFCSFLLHFNKP